MPAVAPERRSLLLFGGSNDRAVYAIARATRQCGEDFAAIAWTDSDRLLEGAYRNRVAVVRHGAELDPTLLAGWVDSARRIAGNQRLVIAPTSEYLNAFLLTIDKALLESLGVTVPLVESDLYAKLTDKASATRLFKDAGIRVPAALPGFRANLLPFVAKPKRNIVGKKVLYPALLHDVSQLDVFLRNHRAEEFFAQEYISGSSKYLLLYRTRNGDLFVSSQANRAQQPHGKSILLAHTDNFHKSDAALATLELLRQVDFHGFAMVEFIVDSEGPCFIEVNPRPWGPLQLALEHRCGIVEAFLGEVLHDDPWRFRDVWTRKPEGGRYLWLGGILATLRSGDTVQWSDPSSTHWREVAASLGSDVYLRSDSLRVFMREAMVR